MKISYLTTILAVCICLPGRAALGGPGQGLRWTGDLEAARAAAKEDSRWLAVFFAARDKLSSRRMETETIPSAESQKALDKFIKVRLDLKRDADIAKACAIDAGPAIVFYDSEGNELDRYVGFVNAQTFIAWTAAISVETSYATAKAGLKNNPRDPKANYHMGRQYLHRRDAKEAWRYFENYLQFDPEDRSAFADNIQLRRIEDLLQAGKTNNVAKALEEFLGKWPESDEKDRAEYLKCRTLWLQGRTRVAEKAFKDFIRNYPESNDRYLAEHALEGLAERAKTTDGE